jgi:hypothetical protein
MLGDVAKIACLRKGILPGRGGSGSEGVQHRTGMVNEVVVFHFTVQKQRCIVAVSPRNHTRI